jgi:hypothetical protein
LLCSRQKPRFLPAVRRSDVCRKRRRRLSAKSN